MTRQVKTVPVVRFSPRSIDSISQALAAGGVERETGGILLGHDRDGFTVIRAGGPGPQAVREPRFFLRDLDHAQHLADDAWKETSSQWIGDWHTHPDGAVHPSPADLRAIAEVLRDAALGLESFLAVIVVPLAGAGWSLHAWEVGLQADWPAVRILRADLTTDSADGVAITG
jgi:integrative and conjugative element protein (TIGR02256 family)